jgi:hypothetical protein
MKQTAVEWLFEQVWITSGEDLPELLEQAKEMEKQQQVYSKEDMEKAFQNGLNRSFDSDFDRWIEKFKKK